MPRYSADSRGGSTVPMTGFFSSCTLGGGAGLAAPVEGGGSSHLLNHLAVVCFVMVGALALRTVAQQAWISPTTGTMCGLAYCLALMVLPRLVARRRPALAVLLSICGGLLWTVIVLEMTHRGDALGPGAAAMVLVGGATVGVLGAALQRSPVQAALILLAQAGGILALDLTPDGGVFRGAGLAALAGLALVIAHLRGWAFLRPLVCVPVGLGLTAGVVLTAHRAPMSLELTPGLLVAAVALLGMLVASVAVRAGKLDAFERACLPVAAVWTYWLAAFSQVDAAHVAGGACGAAALALAWWQGRRPDSDLYPGLVASGSLLLLSVLPRLDPSGLTLALGALITQRLGRGRGARLEPMLAQLMIVAAAATCLLSNAPASPTWAAAALGLTVLLLVHARAARAEERTAWLCTISLCMGAIVFYVAASLLAGQHLTNALGLFRTGLLAIMAVLALGLRRLWGELRYVGFAGLILLGAKVVFWDLAHLDGPYLVGAVLTLGVTAAFASLLQRLWKSREEPTP